MNNSTIINMLFASMRVKHIDIGVECAHIRIKYINSIIYLNRPVYGKILFPAVDIPLLSHFYIRGRAHVETDDGNVVRLLYMCVERVLVLVYKNNLSA